MILTCPECATSYFVDDTRIPPQGRTVKCANCGFRWHASRENEIRGEIEAEAELEAAPAPSAPNVGAVEQSEPLAPSLPDDLDIIIAPARPKAEPPKRKARVGLIAGSALAAGLVIAAGGGLVFRDQVVGAVPAAAEAYAAIGMPPGHDGLVIEQVKSKATFQGGRPVLSVTGAIRNTRQKTLTAPALRVAVLDKAGKPLAAKLARPLNADIPAGSRRYFAIAISDPPAGAHDLEVVFEKAPPPATASIQPVEPGPEPVDAQPLPAGSPDAIPAHG